MKNITTTCGQNAAKIYMLSREYRCLTREIVTLIVLNFKTYRESTGAEALQLAKICEDISDEYSVEMVVVPRGGGYP